MQPEQGKGHSYTVDVRRVTTGTYEYAMIFGRFYYSFKFVAKFNENQQ